MNIELEQTFLHSLERGINLFLGSGFSVHSKDKSGENLPTGSQLGEELAKKFNLSSNITLPQMSTILNSKSKNEFYEYLLRRFQVEEFDKSYYSLTELNIKAIYTTNVDNLVGKIFERSFRSYLQDITQSGPVLNDKYGIDFVPLHGNITNQSRPLIFDSMAIATAFNDSAKIWSYLSEGLKRHPTLFWGYSFSDSSVLQALNLSDSTTIGQKEKWILVQGLDPGQREFFKAMGFYLIEGDTLELLAYISGKVASKSSTVSIHGSKSSVGSPPITEDTVPTSSQGLPVRPIKHFFLGAPPIWSDIYSKSIYVTHFYPEIKDKILSGKNLIVLGTPASGKTTLMMQLSAGVPYDGQKLILSECSENKAILLIRKLNNMKTLLFMDNFSDSIDAFSQFTNCSNLRVVGFDREHNFEIVSHLIDKSNFEFINVTKLSETDIQGIYSSIPDSIRKFEMKKFRVDGIEQKESLFEFVNLNINYPTINERFRSVILEVEKNNVDMADFFIMCCYVHSCRTPVSLDMALAFLSDSINDYSQVLGIKESFGDLITDYSGSLVEDDQDYYQPRSVFVSEAILNQTNHNTLSRVLTRFVKNVPPFRISNYDIFRRRAYDANLIGRAFREWHQGKEFYDAAFTYDYRNPFILQQASLYLDSKKQYQEAFHYIDRALNMTDDFYFSIRNTHAIILFNANINSTKEDSGVRETLDRSMEILMKCYRDDKRKLYHCIRFGEQSIDYDNRYHDEISEEYLKNAYNWTKEESKVNSWNSKLRILKRNLESILSI